MSSKCNILILYYVLLTLHFWTHISLMTLQLQVLILEDLSAVPVVSVSPCLLHCLHICVTCYRQFSALPNLDHCHIMINDTESRPSFMLNWHVNHPDVSVLHKHLFRHHFGWKLLNVYANKLAFIGHKWADTHLHEEY